MLIKRSVFLFIIIALLTGCNPQESHSPTPSKAEPFASTPAPTRESAPQPTPSPSPTTNPTDTPTVTPTPAPAWPVSLGTPLPESVQQISLATKGQIKEIGRWGGPSLDAHPTHWTADGQWLLVDASTGLFIYDQDQFEEIFWPGCGFIDTVQPAQGSSAATLVNCSDELHLVKDFRTEPQDETILPTLGNFLALVLSPDLGTVAYSKRVDPDSADASKIAVYDLATKKFLWSQTVEGEDIYQGDLQYLPGGQQLLVRFRNHADLVNVSDGSLVMTTDVARRWDFFPQAGKILEHSLSKIFIKDVVTGKSHEAPSIFNITHLAFTPSLDALVVTTQANKLVLISLAPGNAEIWRVDLPTQAEPVSLTISPDGRLVLVTQDDGQALLYEIATGKEILSYANQGFVSNLAFSPDGKHLVSQQIPRGPVVRVWNLADGSPALTKEFFDPILAFAFPPDPAQIVTLTMSALQVRELRTGKVLSSCQLDHNMGIFQLFPDGLSVLMPVWDAEKYNSFISKYDLQTCQPTRRYGKSSYSGSSTELALSADGRTLAEWSSYDPQETIRIWDASGAQVASVPFVGRRGATLRFSADGRWIGVALSDGPDAWLELRKPGGALLVREDFPPRFFVDDMTFSPDSSLLAIADSFGLMFYDVTRGEFRGPYPSPTNIKSGMAFSPDGSLLVEGTYEIGILLVNPQTGSATDISGKNLRFNTDACEVMALKFTPDGRYLAVVCRDSLRWYGIPASTP